MPCVHGRPGGDLLSHALRRSTIGAEGFHGRVRDGIGCWDPRYGHQTVNERNSVTGVAPDSVTDPGRRGGAGRPSRPASGSSDCGSYGMMCFESLILMYQAKRALPLRAMVSPVFPGKGKGPEKAIEIKPIERLVPVSFTHCCASTPGLSTWWSSTALGETWF